MAKYHPRTDGTNAGKFVITRPAVNCMGLRTPSDYLPSTEERKQPGTHAPVYYARFSRGINRVGDFPRKSRGKTADHAGHPPQRRKGAKVVISKRTEGPRLFCISLFFFRVFAPSAAMHSHRRCPRLLCICIHLSFLDAIASLRLRVEYSLVMGRCSSPTVKLVLLLASMNYFIALG